MEQLVQPAREGGSISAGHTPRPLRRWEASKYLKDSFGLDMAVSTLAKLACLGGGPEFYKAGRHPLYPIDRLDRWALARRGDLVRSTSEVRRG